MMIRINFLILIYRYIDSESNSAIGTFRQCNFTAHESANVMPELNFGSFPIVYIAIRNLIGIINDLLTKLLNITLSARWSKCFAFAFPCSVTLYELRRNRKLQQKKDYEINLKFKSNLLYIIIWRKKHCIVFEKLGQHFDIQKEMTMPFLSLFISNDETKINF